MPASLASCSRVEVPPSSAGRMSGESAATRSAVFDLDIYGDSKGAKLSLPMELDCFCRFLVQESFKDGKECVEEPGEDGLGEEEPGVVDVVDGGEVEGEAPGEECAEAAELRHPRARRCRNPIPLRSVTITAPPTCREEVHGTVPLGP